MVRNVLEDPQLFNPLIEKGMKYRVAKTAIADNYQLTANHGTLLLLDPNGGNKDVLLPAEASSEGLSFIILNIADAAENLVVKEDSDTTTILTVAQSGAGLFYCDGTTWYGYPLNSALAASVGSLAVTNAATVGTLIDGGPQELSGAGAVDVTSLITYLTTTGADALTLADGTVGQVKIVVMVVDGGDGTLTPTNFGNGTTITFNDVGDAVMLVFRTGNWWLVSNVGATIA